MQGSTDRPILNIKFDIDLVTCCNRLVLSGLMLDKWWLVHKALIQKFQLAHLRSDIFGDVEDQHYIPVGAFFLSFFLSSWLQLGAEQVQLEVNGKTYDINPLTSYQVIPLGVCLRSWSTSIQLKGNNPWLFPMLNLFPSSYIYTQQQAPMAGNFVMVYQPCTSLQLPGKCGSLEFWSQGLW